MYICVCVVSVALLERESNKSDALAKRAQKQRETWAPSCACVGAFAGCVLRVRRASFSIRRSGDGFVSTATKGRPQICGLTRRPASQGFHATPTAPSLASVSWPFFPFWPGITQKELRLLACLFFGWQKSLDADIFFHSQRFSCWNLRCEHRLLAFTLTGQNNSLGFRIFVQTLWLSTLDIFVVAQKNMFIQIQKIMCFIAAHLSLSEIYC